MDDPRRALEDAMLRAHELPKQDLATRLQWMEDVALAAERADLGDDGARAARDMKAALGAILKFARGPQTQSALGELELMVGALTARATSTLFRALARDYDALARTKGAPRRAESMQLAVAFDELAAAVEKGEPIAQRTIDRVAEVRRSAFGH